MKLKKCLLFILTSIFVITSCTVGMGEEPDKEAPVINILEPSPNAYVGLEFKLKGTCSDNIKVVEVEISNEKTGEIYGKANISGEQWTYDMILSLEDEGELQLLCKAKDRMGNESSKSVKSILLLVDATPPEGLSWYVDKGNGIPIPLYDKDFLEELNTNVSKNKDIPQNERFSIHGRFHDEMSIKETILKLVEIKDNGEKNLIISKKVPVVEYSVEENMYSPEWEFTHEELVNAEPSLARGKHYLQIEYETLDDQGNKRKAENACLLWYPESDKPGISLTRLRENNTIVETVGNTIPVEFFDDDEISEIYYALKTPANYATLDSEKLITDEDYRTTFFTQSGEYEICGKQTFSNEQRDDTITFIAPNKPMEMWFVALAKDVKGVWNQVQVNAQITDNSSPLLYINQPGENTVPTMEGETFSFKGYSMDTKGSAYIKMVYIPGEKSSLEKEAHAKELFIEYKDNTKEKVKRDSGEIIWYYKLKDGVEDGTWKNQSFEFTCNLMEDFGEEARNNKFFEFYLVDVDGNEIYRPYIISGDTSKPSVNIASPEKDMWICDYSKDGLEIKFKGVKDSGLGMNENSYRLEFNNTEYTVGNGLTIDAEGFATCTFDKNTLKTWAEVNNNAQPNFTFYVKDILGNENTAKRTVVLSPLPTLSSISTGKASGLYKMGDEIPIQVVFSSQVKVTGTPKLVLHYSEDDSDKLVDYVSGSGTDTLNFTFTVPQGASSEKLLCSGFITDDNNKIETASNGTGNAHLNIPKGKNLQDSKIIQLDGIQPYIEEIDFICENKTGSEYNVKVGDEIKAVVTMNEKININGSSIITLASGSGQIDFGFLSINNNEITFVYKVSELTPNGALICYMNNCIKDLSTIVDEAGNASKQLASGEKKPNIVIDTKAPETPSIDIEAGNYNEIVTLTIENIESGAKVYYSSDGGLTYTEYDEEAKPTFSTGNYIFVAKQEDKAGNVSNVSSSVEVEIDVDFPVVEEFKINKTKGNYKEGEIIPIKLTFASEVKVNENDIILTLSDEDGNNEVQIPAEISNSTRNVTFNYVVKEGDYFEGIKIKEVAISEDFTDIYGNKPESGTIETAIIDNPNSKKTDIVLDGKKPEITGKTLSNNTITLTFSENVFKESGDIILRRTEGWYIPPVLTEEEFEAIYGELNGKTEYQEKLILKDADGVIVTHSKTGQPLGPYKKITHGLLEGSNVPDTKTKYVLDFNLDINSGSCSVDGYTFDVAEIREAFEAANYHQQVLDVTSKDVVITDNVVEINFQEELQDGIEWELIIDETAFRDETGNSFVALESDKRVFWSANVANPVIRVDRYSHGWGAEEPKSDGSLQIIENYGDNSDSVNTGATLSPTGYARVRIDCQTPGASIYYGVMGNETRQQDTNATEIYTLDNYDTITDMTFDEISAITLGTEYTKFIIVGDGNLYTSRRDYVKAIATKGTIESQPAYEGVFKTVVIHKETGGKNIITIEGSTSAGGMPIISGYPLLDATVDKRYGKNAYNAGNKTIWVWHSYEMVSNFTEMGKVNNYTQNYFKTGYGLLTFVYNTSWYD